MAKYMDSGGLSHFMTKIKEAIAATVTGVKGNAESSYRTGQVNITPANVGAVNKSGDTMTGALTWASTQTFPEAYLTWGGKNFSASYGPIDAAMIGELGANRLAFSKAAGITIEYTRDGGTTWIDYGWADSYKVDLFARGRGCPIGKYAGSSELGQVTTDWKVRVTLTTNLSGTYTALNKFAFYVTTNGASRSYVTITGRTKANLDAGNDTWTTFAEDQTVSGWSGWNIVNTSSITTYGNTSSQYANIRFEFGITGTLSTTYSNALSINRIMGFGGVGWGAPSNMAIDGHLYSYNSSQDAIFPASVSPGTNNAQNLGAGSLKWANVFATTFNGSLVGDVTGTASGNLPKSGGTITGYLTLGSNTQSSIANAGIMVNDVRNATLTANMLSTAANFYFTNNGTPNSNWWSLLYVRGWTSGAYTAWMLAGPAHNADMSNTPLYVRTSNGTNQTWGSWREIFDSGHIIPAANGGTGQTSLVDSANALINALTTGSADPIDTDYYVSQYTGGGTTYTTFHRRPMSALWNYIKGKISSVLGLTDSQYGGNAATATTAGNVTGTVAIANGGTGKTTAAEAWTALGGGAIGKKASLAASDIPAHASTATTYGAGSSTNYGHLKLSDSTASTSGTSGGTAATPSAVKAAYDKAAEAMSAATGGLYYDIGYEIDINPNTGVTEVTGIPRVYSAGTEVTSNYAKTCFSWSYRIGTTDSWVSLTTNNDRTCTVALSTVGMWGTLKCDFTPA